jgi:SAM-dependent methyltransferase
MYCLVCGKNSKKFVFKKILSDELVADWGLTKKQRKRRDIKESMFCSVCNSSMRDRALAKGIMKTKVFKGVSSLSGWVLKASLAEVKVAEINYCGNLHTVLSKLPGLVLSQYSETTFRAKVFNYLKRIKKEDITDLSYKDCSFDLVVHSEVLEHVDDVDKALSECKRVLKPSGVCVFTAPVVMERSTVKRAEINVETAKVRHLLKASYHGSGEKNNLVFWEFGGDFVKDRNLEIVHKTPRGEVYVFRLKKTG